MSPKADDSDADRLAAVLGGLAHARQLATAKRQDRLLVGPRRLYPMGLASAQMAVNPFEFFLLIAFFVVGLAYVVGVAVPGSVTDLLPPFWTKVWVANMWLGSIFALTGGLYRRDADRGLLVYQFGWGLAGMGAAVYGLAVLIKFPIVGLNPGLTNLLLSVACLVRVLQIQRFFKIALLMAQGLLYLPTVPAQHPEAGDSHVDIRRPG